MLCLHGEPAGSRFIKVYNGRQMLPSQRTFWYCKQSSTCHFELYGNDKYKTLYCEGVKTFLATNQEVPKCCAVNKSPMNDESSHGPLDYPKPHAARVGAGLARGNGFIIARHPRAKKKPSCILRIEYPYKPYDDVIIGSPRKPSGIFHYYCSDFNPFNIA